MWGLCMTTIAMAWLFIGLQGLATCWQILEEKHVATCVCLIQTPERHSLIDLPQLGEIRPIVTGRLSLDRGTQCNPVYLSKWAWFSKACTGMVGCTTTSIVSPYRTWSPRGQWSRREWSPLPHVLIIAIWLHHTCLGIGGPYIALCHHRNVSQQHQPIKIMTVYRRRKKRSLLETTGITY